MTIDEAIKHAKKVAEVQEEAAKEWHENQVRECEPIRFPKIDYTHENECKKCADEHKQLAEWLKELKAYKEQEPCEDAISRAQALSDYADWYGCGYSYNTFYEHLKNMPSIQPKTDVLDKIRAEIEQERVGYPPSAGYYKAIIKCLQIIDKYKAESEEKE